MHNYSWWIPIIMIIVWGGYVLIEYDRNYSFAQNFVMEGFVLVIGLTVWVLGEFLCWWIL